MRNFSETVRLSADIVRVVTDYVALKGAGNTFKALCPFHSEKTPSFSVHREKQIFHCFGCGVGGDVFKFVMLAEKVTFPESVRIVAEKCGIPIPLEPEKDDQQAVERKRLLDLYERASNYFCEMLECEDGWRARQILEERKVRREFARKFRLGYAPQSGLLNALRPADPVSTGLFVKNEQGEVYDRFRRRLMFPISNDRGRTIAFGGRIIGEGQPKYLNSPESLLYSKSFVLYALHLAREAARKVGRMVLVEGYFDCLSLHQSGFENVVASCGTSLTSQQVAVLARYVPEVVMNYDPDSAGQSATRRSIELLLDRGLRVRILKLPGGLDPDDFIRKEGSESYSRLLANGPYFWEYLVAEAASRSDLGRPEVKARVVGDILHYVARIQDSVEKLEVGRAVAERFKLPEGVVLARLEEERQGSKPHPAPGVSATRKLTLAEKQVIQALLQNPQIAGSLERFLEDAFLSGIWSGPVLKRMITNPSENVETVLDNLEDQDLQREVRAAVLEPFPKIAPEVAMVSMGQLYQEHLTRQEKEIREQLKKYGSGAAPAELVRKQMEIAVEKSRLETMTP